MARTPVVYAPCLCVVAQGQKYAVPGEETFQYNANNYLVRSLPPIESEIKRASPASPAIGVVLTFQPFRGWQNSHWKLGMRTNGQSPPLRLRRPPAGCQEGFTGHWRRC